jgi:hypothetical protein
LLIGKKFFAFCRSKSALAAKLEARKKKRHGAEYAKLSKQMLMEENALQRKNLENKQQENQLMGANSTKTDTSGVLIGNLPTGATRPDSRQPSSGSGSSGGLGVKLTGNQEQDWVNMLMASPVFKQINDLENMLEKSDASDEMLRPHVKGMGILNLIVLAYLLLISRYLWQLIQPSSSNPASTCLTLQWYS